MVCGNLIQVDLTGHLTLQTVSLDARSAFVQTCKTVWFLLMQDGTAECVLPSGIKVLSAGDLYVISKGGQVSLRPLRGKPAAFSIFSVSLEQMFPLFLTAEVLLVNEIGESLRSGRYFPASDPVAIRCQRLVREVAKHVDLDHRAQLIRIVAAVLNGEMAALRNLRTASLDKGDQIEHLLRSLSANELMELSIDDLALKLGCGRRHLSRLFQKQFGTSVSGLKVEMRMMKAVALLRDPNTKIISVAEECGYNHLSLFNSFFKKRFGLTPGEWRKRALHAETAEDQVQPPKQKLRILLSAKNKIAPHPALRPNARQNVGDRRAREASAYSL